MVRFTRRCDSQLSHSDRISLSMDFSVPHGILALELDNLSVNYTFCAYTGVGFALSYGVRIHFLEGGENVFGLDLLDGCSIQRENFVGEKLCFQSAFEGYEFHEVISEMHY